MLIMHFIGRTTPSSQSLTVRSPKVQGHIFSAGRTTGILVSYQVSINCFVVNVRCEIECERPDYKAEYTVELLKRATDLSKCLVSLAAFSTCIGFSVSLDHCIDPDGNPSPINPVQLNCIPLCTAFSLDPSRSSDLDSILKMAFVDHNLTQALHDLTQSISQFHVGPVNCGRVIDAIRKLITPTAPRDRPGPGWRAMQSALNISQGYQEWITEQSVGPRHADPAFVPGNVIEEITRRTWTIMNRYLEYRKRGCAPLTAPEFPNLS